MGAYITLFFVIDSLAPIWNISGETSVSWGYAFFISLSVSIAAAVLGIVSFFVRPRRKKPVTSDVIPKVQEIKNEQQNMRYNIVSPAEKTGDKNMKIETVRGVLPVFIREQKFQFRMEKTFGLDELRIMI